MFYFKQTGVGVCVCVCVCFQILLKRISVKPFPILLRYVFKCLTTKLFNLLRIGKRNKYLILVKINRVKINLEKYKRLSQKNGLFRAAKF